MEWPRTSLIAEITKFKLEGTAAAKTVVDVSPSLGVGITNSGVHWGVALKLVYDETLATVVSVLCTGEEFAVANSSPPNTILSGLDKSDVTDPAAGLNGSIRYQKAA